jgi:hypothetical protein
VVAISSPVITRRFAETIIRMRTLDAGNSANDELRLVAQRLLFTLSLEASVRHVPLGTANRD